MNAYRTNEFASASNEVAGRGQEEISSRRNHNRRTIGYPLIFLLVLAAVAAAVRDPSIVTISIAFLYAVGIVWLARKWRPAPHDPRRDDDSPAARLARARADLQWSRSWLLLFPIGLWYTAILKFSAMTDYSLATFFPKVFASASRGEGATIAMGILCGVLVYFAGRSYRARRRVQELELLCEAPKSAP